MTGILHGTCLLVVRLDGAPGNSPDRITMATAVLMASFFETLAFGALTLSLGLEAKPLAYGAVASVLIILLAANWIFGTRREEYQAYLRAPREARKRLVILAGSLNASAFLGLAVVGVIRLY